jgi:hypothetical protein
VLVAACLVLLLAGAAIFYVGRIPLSVDVLRQRVVQTLSERLEAEVELGDLSLRVFPQLHVEGTQLTIRHKRRHDVPPLISIERFTVDASLGTLWHEHVGRVSLVGLDIQIPPGNNDPSARSSPSSDRSLGNEVSSSRPRHDVVVDELVADEAKLTIIPRERDKKPKTWVMHELHVQNVGVDRQMPFRSNLTNAVPPGEIDTTGTFGPWNRDDPSRTPLDGTFTFDRADLSVFKGISGILAAHGTFAGSLGQIDVHGETDTPDFKVNLSGHAVPLKTKYRAIVDSTNGDTELDEVDASFLNTALVAKGGVFDVKGADGRRVVLDITIEKGRLEDIMRMAVNTPVPPMTGGLRLKTSFELPPGNVDVVEKLKLNGQFMISGGRFTDPVVQRKINELSQRASGKPLKEDPKKVASAFSGQFALGGGLLALPKLTFDVPGAVVYVNGRYALRRETLAFNGDLIMDAKLSQTTSGIKSLLLKIVDPLFRRNGRTVVPIRINGTRANPDFGLDVGRVFK